MQDPDVFGAARFEFAAGSALVWEVVVVDGVIVVAGRGRCCGGGGA